MPLIWALSFRYVVTAALAAAAWTTCGARVTETSAPARHGQQQRDEQ